MYENAREMIAGYTKSLWCAFGSPLGGLAVSAALAVVYVLPALAFVCAPRTPVGQLGLAGYLAAVLGRIVVARACRQPVLPDALAHPLSILGFAALVCTSIIKQRRGSLVWKGRALP
jgi:hypothetical protein